MDGLPLTDADLVLFERRVVLSDQHGGGDAITAAVGLMRRGKDGKKRMGEKVEKTEGGWGEQGKDGEDAGKEDEDN